MRVTRSINRGLFWLFGGRNLPPRPRTNTLARLPRSGRVLSVNELPPAPARSGWWHGEKFAGGMGSPIQLVTDYWTLRARSSELFSTNLYARGLVRRLIANEINTGLHLEAKPEEAILGYKKDGLADWSESVENRFGLWERRPALCDVEERLTFGGLQAQARLEALVAGDVLVTLRQDERTGLQRIKLINGASVQTPLVPPRSGNRILHGVEFDKHGKHVAYWVVQPDLITHKRMPAFGTGGRRLAWLVYGTDKRLDDTRGEPMLSLFLQSLKEIDRYRDAVQRKAAINSVLAMFIKREQPSVGERSFANAGITRGVDSTVDSTGQSRSFNFADYLPGLVLDELEPGQEPHGFMPNGTDEKFADFESAMLRTIAWSSHVPPETLTLTFQSNYSASQAATNEFKMYLNVVRTDFGNQFCHACYEEFLLSEALNRNVDAPGMLRAWRDPKSWDTYTAWVASSWSGHIKPAIDMQKLVGAYEKMIGLGAITRDRASMELSGTKFSKNVQQLARENQQLAEANRPLGELESSAEDESKSAEELDQQDSEEQSSRERAHLRAISS